MSKRKKIAIATAAVIAATALGWLLAGLLAMLAKVGLLLLLAVAIVVIWWVAYKLA